MRMIPAQLRLANRQRSLGKCRSSCEIALIAKQRRQVPKRVGSCHVILPEPCLADRQGTLIERPGGRNHPGEPAQTREVVDGVGEGLGVVFAQLRLEDRQAQLMQPRASAKSLWAESSSARPLRDVAVFG